MEKMKNNKALIAIISSVIVMIIIFICFTSQKGKNNNENVKQENVQDINSTIQYDENMAKELKEKIENLELEYINNNDNARQYAEGTFEEISNITKENYQNYFQSEEEYGKYVAEVYMKICEYTNEVVQDFSKSKIDTKTFSNRILPLIKQGNSFIDYMQENPSIYFKESYTNVKGAKYDALQKEISNSYIFFDMEFAQAVSDIVTAYNNGELPNGRDKYLEKSQKVAERIIELKSNDSNITLRDFVNNNYSGDNNIITDSILTDINTFSNFSNTYNSSSGTAVSNLVTNYGELLTQIGDDFKY